MGEEFKEAIENIINSVKQQNQQFWRHFAAKDCLEKEIDQLKDKVGSSQKLIQPITDGSLLKCSLKANNRLQEIPNKQIEYYKLFQGAIRAKHSERELINIQNIKWNEKYEKLLLDFKKQYQETKIFLENSNPLFKEYIELQNQIRLLKFNIKNNETKAKIKKKINLKLKHIYQKRLNFTVLEFIKALKIYNEDQQVSMELKRLENEKREIMKTLIEMQQQSRLTRIGTEKTFAHFYPLKLPIQMDDVNKNDDLEHPIKIKKVSENNDIKKQVLSIKKNSQINFQQNNKENPSKDQNKKLALSSLRSTLSKTLEARRNLNTSLNSTFRCNKNTQLENEVLLNKQENQKPVIHSNVLLQKKDGKKNQVINDDNFLVQYTPPSQLETRKRLLAQKFDNLKTIKLISSSNDANQTKEINNTMDVTAIINTTDLNETNETANQNYFLKSETILTSNKKPEDIKRKLPILKKETGPTKKEKMVVNFSSPIQEQFEFVDQISFENTDVNSSRDSIISETKDTSLCSNIFGKNDSKDQDDLLTNQGKISNAQDTQNIPYFKFIPEFGGESDFFLK